MANLLARASSLLAIKLDDRPNSSSNQLRTNYRNGIWLLINTVVVNSPGDWATWSVSSVFSECELTFAFAICCRPSVSLSVVCRLSVCVSSVTFVRPTQAVQIFRHISTALVPWPSIDVHRKFYGDRPRGTPPSGELNSRG